MSWQNDLPDINSRGHLKIFFGYAVGVGKTYAMLDDAQVQYQNGVDVIVGYIKPSMEPVTEELLKGLPILPVKEIDEDRKEFDLDGALERKPKLILVDELEHSNLLGVRNRKRYQDIEELLNAGIDVYTTVNVQNIESLNDIVQSITHEYVEETVPDYIFDHADKVKLIDIEPDELLRRHETCRNKKNVEENDRKNCFLTRENLRLLREVAMRKAADRISHNNLSEGIPADKTTNTKILVCISSSPSSAKCIRWAARMADAFHAPWIVVYVENKDNELDTEERKKNFQANIELAEQLGAEIATLNGNDIAATVSKYAKLSGITNIVIGKSRNKKNIKSFFEIDFEDKLISLLDNTEIHIIPDNNTKKKYHKHKNYTLRRNLSFSWIDLFKMSGILLITTLVSAVLTRFDFSNQNLIMLYILSVLIISRITSGYVYGIIASVLCVMIDNYFFMEPYFTLNVFQQDYPITFVVMLLTALFTSTMTNRIKTQAEFAQDREQSIEVLYEINKKLLVTRGLKNIVKLTNRYITRIFGKAIIFYTSDPVNGEEGIIMKSPEDADVDFFKSSEEKAIAHWVFINQKRAGAGTDTSSGAKAYYMPVISQGNVLGVIGISCKNGSVLSHNNRSFLRRIGSLVAMALERQRLSDEQRAILVETEKEKMRSNLLRAISHDLRTPLTGILGASSAILENRDALDGETKDKLLLHIKDDSQWLIRMVENLLSVTRINEDTANVTKTPEAAEEIVAAAISRIRKGFPNQKINVTVPEELLMVPMDGTLIEQVIINLIENAIKHSGFDTIINVSLIKDNNMALFEVKDNGEGISEQDLPYLFESYVPNGKKTSDSSRGMGIGLSICKSIINAHQGKIEAYNQAEGGAVFRFSLPL
ncbi:MAG TPA: sensor histidine kinase KdpD [Mobilitalea sp.]|nr:sensor histidine kinase KdpD [Mobilitalea sp.]